MKRSGLTLIEVVGSLLLMATIGATLLAALRDSQHQASQAARRNAAMAAADSLLHAWYGGNRPMMISGQWEEFNWRVTPIRTIELEHSDISLDVVRLSFWEFASKEPLVELDVLLDKKTQFRLDAD